MGGPPFKGGLGEVNGVEEIRDVPMRAEWLGGETEESSLGLTSKNAQPLSRPQVVEPACQPF